MHMQNPDESHRSVPVVHVGTGGRHSSWQMHPEPVQQLDRPRHPARHVSHALPEPPPVPVDPPEQTPDP